jgi:S1-C subfamily serine protease
MRLRRAVFTLAVGAVGAFGGLVVGSGVIGESEAARRAPVLVPPHLDTEERATVELFRESQEAVVFITSLARPRAFRLDAQAIPRGNGTGFVWDEDGHVVTNYHVIQGANGARVTLSDQSTWDARLVGAAPEKDLAVLHIEAPSDRLHPIPRGSAQDLQVGQKVFAIGNPFGLDHTLTTGIISALGREIPSQSNAPIRDVIQTDAAINPGNSGGPLLDSAGRLIGVNTAIFSPSGAYAGIGFAIPVDTVSWAVPDLIAHGKIQRPALGVQVAGASLARRLGADGVLVLSVIRGSGAERAGLQPTRRDRKGRVQLGDVILAVGGKPVASSADLVLALESHRIGDSIEIRLRRAGREETARVELQAAS